MDWKDVGNWLKKNAGAGASVVGALLTGGPAAGAAAAISMIVGATNESDPARALEALQQNPATMLRLRELALQDEASIREHVRLMEEARLKDEQAAHKEQQETIRTGDNSQDIYVRHTRPKMARQSWYATAVYVVGFEIAKACGYGEGASVELALLMAAPAGAYLGFRSWEKRSMASASKKQAA